jgi:hypothetical protein
VKDWRDYRRSEVAIRELEKEFGLLQVQPSWEYERTAPSSGQLKKAEREQSALEPVKIQLQKAIDTAALDRPTMLEFIIRLKKSGVEAKVNFQSTGRVQGLTYELSEIKFSGTQLGKAYTFPGIQKYRGVTYNDNETEILKGHSPQSPILTPPETTPNLQSYGKPKSRSTSLEL